MTIRVRTSILVFAAAVLTCAAAAGYWYLAAGRDVRRVESARRELLRTLGTQRVLTARLSGAPHAVLPALRGVAARPDRSPDLRIAAARLEQAARDSLTPVALAGLGTGRLAMGDLPAAIRTLEASWRFEERPETGVDLTAAYLARFEAERRYSDLPRALDAIERSLEIAPRMPEAAFNRALALEQTGARHQARAAWQAYLTLDPRGGWAEEARLRLARLDETAGDWDQWAKQHGVSAAAAIETPVLTAGVRRFPQAAREWLERDVWPAWSDARRAQDTTRMDTARRNGRAIATALFEVTGDRLALDAATALERRATDDQLADGLLAYASGVAHYRKHERAAAATVLATAESALRAAGSPMWMWAAVQRAVVDYHLRDLDSASARLTTVDREAERHQYPLVRARIAWIRGLLEMQRGRLADAVPFYRRAAEVYDAAGETENAGHVFNTWADTLRVTGEYRAGWTVLGEALQRTPAFREPIRRYVVFFNASLYARREDLLHASLAFEDEAVAHAEQDTASPAAAVEARLRRAALLGQLGRRNSADADLRSASALLPSVRDPTQARYFTATRDAVTAEVFGERADAVASADAALDVLAKAEPADVPRVLLAKARAQRHARRLDDAERTVLEAIERFEARRRLLQASDDRIAYLDHGVDLYRELAAVRLDRGDGSERVFEAVERGRARTLFEDLAGTAASASSLADIRSSLPGRTSAVIYSVLPDRLLTWVVGPQGSRFEQIRIDQREVRSRVERLETLLALGSSSAQARAAVEALNQLLIGEWIQGVAKESTLIFIPDGPLHQIPFAMLGTTTARPLAADFAVALAPSATLLARQTYRESGQAARRPLLVGDIPAADTGPDALPELPQSRIEVQEIAALNPGAEILTRVDATLSAVRLRLPQASFVHFAGHAIVDAYAPQLSRLVLAPEPGARGGAALYASDIARLDLRGVRTVVLAACETAGGPLRNGEGVASIARSFLAAGVPTVVATLWKIDDTAARTAFVAMHRAMLTGVSAEEALRRVQQAMQGSSDPLLRDPRQWAGLVVIRIGGAGSAAKEKS